MIVTSDNPRSENPRAIIADIRRGVRGSCTIEPDRRRAIARGARAARRGDVVLIAGKGHEAYQEIRGVRHPFSDRAGGARGAAGGARMMMRLSEAAQVLGGAAARRATPRLTRLPPTAARSRAAICSSR